MTPSLPDRLARKWREFCWRTHHAEGLCYECTPAAIREALEVTRSVIEGRIKELRTFKLARNTYVPAIVRELEIVSEKLETLKGEARDEAYPPR